MEQQENPTKQKKQFSLTLLVRILIGVLAVVSLVVFASSLMKYNALEEEKQAQIERLESLGVEKERIEEMERLKKENYFEYVVRTAREKLGLYFPDEEIYYSDLNQ